MKTNTLFLFAALALTAAAPASAQYADAQALHQAASGKRFQVGRSTYRLLSDATVRTAPQMAGNGTQRAQVAAADGGGTVAARIGPYAIVVGGNARAGTAAAASSLAADGAALRAAVDERSGQPVVVTGKLKLFGTTQDAARALARRSGGHLVYASDVDGSAMIDYGSADAAMAASRQLQGAPGTREVSMEIVQGFNRAL
ncbi:hypothetical protein ACP93_11200 [Xanthomonas sp. NCPPB 1128]|uniref:hypothetical protein n=1 Tax=Xanthomonas sp. NCPPB 1128 TaxID=1775876 RepID=UPI00065ABD80|nr:hypothetical protein [Xanthomonas sp. NCPPB 1128]KMM75488.1 hypothetical protein ACP93_11200 [Xanthomonas sp. NCPPB 1128]